jgi:hypothetical protein
MIPVNDIFLITADNLLDWIAVFGYLGLTVFIMWRIMAAK